MSRQVRVQRAKAPCAASTAQSGRRATPAFPIMHCVMAVTATDHVLRRPRALALRERGTMWPSPELVGARPPTGETTMADETHLRELASRCLWLSHNCYDLTAAASSHRDRDRRRSRRERSATPNRSAKKRQLVAISGADHSIPFLRSTVTGRVIPNVSHFDRRSGCGRRRVNNHWEEPGTRRW